MGEVDQLPATAPVDPVQAYRDAVDNEERSGKAHSAARRCKSRTATSSLIVGGRTGGFRLLQGAGAFRAALRSASDWRCVAHA